MKISSKWIKGVLAVVALLAFAGTGYAQDANTGSISGTITDATGAVVKGATVTLTNTDRGTVERTLTTNAAGYYTATSLPLGAYSVKISEPGFKGKTVQNLQLHVADALTVNGSLSAAKRRKALRFPQTKLG